MYMRLQLNVKGRISFIDSISSQVTLNIGSLKSIGGIMYIIFCHNRTFSLKQKINYQGLPENMKSFNCIGGKNIVQ